MKLNKSLAALTVGAALFSGIAFGNSVEASYGIYDMNSMNKPRKTDVADKKPNDDKSKVKKPTSTYRSNPFNYVNWSIQGTITQNKRGISGAAIYVVEYDDGGDTPKYYMDGNTVVFENIGKGQMVSCTQEKGNFVTLDFKAPAHINVIVFAPSLGMRYFSLDKRNYLGRYDYDFGDLDETKTAVYHDGIIK